MATVNLPTLQWRRLGPYIPVTSPPGPAVLMTLLKDSIGTDSQYWNVVSSSADTGTYFLLGPKSTDERNNPHQRIIVARNLLDGGYFASPDDVHSNPEGRFVIGITPDHRSGSFVGHESSSPFGTSSWSGYWHWGLGTLSSSYEAGFFESEASICLWMRGSTNPYAAIAGQVAHFSGTGLNGMITGGASVIAKTGNRFWDQQDAFMSWDSAAYGAHAGVYSGTIGSLTWTPIIRIGDDVGSWGENDPAYGTGSLQTGYELNYVRQSGGTHVGASRGLLRSNDSPGIACMSGSAQPKDHVYGLSSWNVDAQDTVYFYPASGSGLPEGAASGSYNWYTVGGNVNQISGSGMILQLTSDRHPTQTIEITGSAPVPFEFPSRLQGDPSGFVDTGYELSVLQNPEVVFNSMSMGFDGNNIISMSSTGVSGAHDFTTQMAASWWMKLDKVFDAGSAFIFSQGDLTEPAQDWSFKFAAGLDYDGEDTELTVFISEGGRESGIPKGSVSIGTLARPGCWNHYAFTYDGLVSGAAGDPDRNVLKIYANNNRLSGTYEDTPFQPKMHGTTASIVVGGITNGFQYADILTSGALDNISFWTGSMSGSAISEIYNSGSYFDLTQHSQAGQLVSWYKIGDGDSGSTIIDVVSGVNGTVVNSTGSGFFLPDSRHVDGQESQFTLLNAIGSVADSNVSDIDVYATATYGVTGCFGNVNPITGNLVLQLNGTNDVHIGSTGSFFFDARLEDGTPYEVTAVLTPSGTTAVIASGSDVIKGGAPKPLVGLTFINYTIGGRYTGTLSSSVIQLNGADDLTIQPDSDWTFSASLNWGNEYTVSLFTTGANETVSINFPPAGSGIITGSVNDVFISGTIVGVQSPPTASATAEWLRQSGTLSP